MHQHWTCACGHVVHGNSDEEIVKRAQEHVRKAHGKEESRDQILKTAKEFQH